MNDLSKCENTNSKVFCRYGCVVLFFNVYILVNLIIVSTILPILILVLAPLTLGFIYLSFREIFLGKDNNEEIKEEVKETSPIIQLN